MPTNDFLPFGVAGGANVLTQANYNALVARSSGFTSGIARADELNKVWRQASVASYVFGQFIADIGARDALDDSNTSGLLGHFKAAYRSQKTNFQTIGGTANELTMTPSPAFLNMTELEGVPLRARIPTKNTNAVTLNVSGLGGRQIVYPDGAPVIAGHLFVGRLCEFIYISATDKFVIISPAYAESRAPAGARVAMYNAAGTYSWVAPAGWSLAFVELWSGGGGGAGSWLGGGANGPGGGGGSGAYCAKYIDVTPDTAYSIVVGAGGAPGAVGNNGGSGGTSSFAGYISATGGGGGQWAGMGAIAGFGGAGGAPVGGEIAVGGGDGGGWSPAALPKGIGGSGGGAPMGGSGGPGNYASGASGRKPGGGGSGCGGEIQLLGQPGADGTVIITRAA